MKNNFLKYLSVALMLTIFSCAEIPKEQMKMQIQNFDLPQKASQEKALIYVVRPAWVGKIVPFRVFLDDTDSSSKMGHNFGSNYIYFFVTPGHHKIYSKAENTAEIEIDAQAGKEIFVKQIATLGIIMGRNKLQQIDEIEGKFAVKNSSLGNITKTFK